jgi:hypothetical protein
MTSPAPPPTKTEERVHSLVHMLLAPSVLGLFCFILSQANPGGAWWLFAGFGNAVGLLGLAVAVLIALVATGRRRIHGPILLLMLLEIGAVAAVSWSAARLLKSPWF